jgi:CHASE2 domain-containing sensor protein/signal transduction histidine kinase
MIFVRTWSGLPVGRRFLYEWLCVGCLGLAAILIAALYGMTASIDHLIFDRYLRLNLRSALPDIVVVEIDNESVAKLGRWPWPRSVHARALDEIAKAQPAAVVYDVLFTEPSDDDATLARAMARNPTYLPILLTPQDSRGERVAIEPVAPLARAAAGLGHINFEVNSDGVVRSVALFEGDANTRWPQLMAPLARAIGDGTIKLRDVDGGASAAARRREARTFASSDEGRFMIPFSPLAAPYRKVSFAALLEGSVPPDVLRGKIVLIGVTASGLYDRFSTPMSGTLGPMPGVYIHAAVLDTLLTGREIDPASGPLVFAFSLAPLVALLAGLLMLSPLRALLLTAALCAVTALCSAAGLFGLQIWFSPMPAIAGLVTVYPIWNWRRLEMTMAYLRKELQHLADEPYLLPETPRPRREFGGDVLEQHMALMAQAAQRVQDMKRFVWDSLNSVPEPILVSDVHGVVVIANHAAKRYFETLHAGNPIGKSLRAALGDLMFIKTIDAGGDADAWVRANWPAMLDPARREFSRLMEQGCEVRDRHARDLLLRYAKRANAYGEATGWIAGLVDVTALHAAERQREDALRLLTHEVRSPQASILALVEIERARASESAHTRELLSRIERYARRSLALADDFVRLARAESQAYELEPVSLLELMIDASDEVWPQAQTKQIHLDVQYGEQDFNHWINADRSLLTRVLVNIMNNAVKYSPGGTQITCTIGQDAPPSPGMPAHVRCTVRDEGYGIPAERQGHLFERFQRFHEAQCPEVSGAGLGMAFVKTVVTRHGGGIRVASAVGEGTAITIVLPALDETAA